MTSRVEAVRDAIMRAASENLTYEQIAQAAIEASDAWLKEDRRAKDMAVLRGEYPMPRRPDK